MSNNAEHLESQSCPIDRRDPEARCGKMWAVRALFGSPGMSRIAVWVDFIVALFGSMTLMPFCVGIMAVKGTVVWMYVFAG